jgi:hypothetical protein
MRLVYFSPVTWNSFNQRSHEFVRYFHETTGGVVLWVNPYPTRLPSWSDHRRLAIATPIAFERPSWLEEISPSALPIEPAAGGTTINRILFWGPIIDRISDFRGNGPSLLCIGKPAALALLVLNEISFSLTFYDAMDDFPAFYRGLSRRSMANNERHIIKKVHHVFASATALAERLRTFGVDPILLRNGCNTAQLPAISEQLNTPHVLGYVGTMGAWFDWDLIYALAAANPDTAIKLVGPVFKTSGRKLPQNVQISPPCDHKAALQIMKGFSVGLIPFKKNRLTLSVDPIKFYEYRALGLPVISTRFGEMALRANENGVFLIDGSDDLQTVVNAALQHKSLPASTALFRTEHDWKARFKLVGGFFSNLQYTVPEENTQWRELQ